jgi:co-chaperonin GroES (HSP10)
MFRPLGDRVLIRPRAQPTQTASGIHLAEQWKPEQVGTVIAVGQPRHPLKDEAFDLAGRIELRASTRAPYEPHEPEFDAAQMLRDLTGKEPAVKVGDEVIFSWQAGHELWVNHGEDRVLLMREGDLLAVVDPA